MRARSALLGERIARQGFAGRPCTSPAEAAARTCAIQAQDTQASRLGIRARAGASTAKNVLHAIEQDRSVTRTWLMRGTIHLVDTRDLRWLVRLIGPTLIGKFRTRWAQLGLTESLLERASELLPRLLADGPLTRHEIRAGLAEQGVPFDSTHPQVPTHVLLYLSAAGLVCRGPDRGRDASFTLLDAWVPDAPAGPSGDDALAEIARRYFAAFSPATAADFTAWSGLPSSLAIRLIRDELTPVDVDGRAGFRLGEVEPARGLRLLPAFDNYLLGYRNRDAILAPELHGHVYAGGIIRSSVLLDGGVVGVWSLDKSKDPVPVTVRPFAQLPRRLTDALQAEVDDVGRFIDRAAVLQASTAEM